MMPIRKINQWRLLMLLLVLSAAGCRGSEANPKPSGTEATATATLSSTPIHTLTAPATLPGEPTATSTPRPSPTYIPFPCEVPYLTAVAGVRWTYAVNGSPAGDFDFSQNVSAIRSDNFALSSRIANETYMHTWTCAPEGLTAQQFDGVAAAGIALAGGRVTLETDSVQGITLPATLASGDRWQQIYTVSGVQSLEGLPDAPVSGAVTMNYEVIGVEIVVVPYGSFEALRIRTSSVYDLRVGSPPFSFVPEIFGISDAYYVEGIGLVKVVTDLSLMGEQRHVVVELIEYAFPD